jgi:hypothetical protein
LVAYDPASKELCEIVEFELEHVGIDTKEARRKDNIRSARRKASVRESVEAVVYCRSEPARIEVFYPDGSRAGRLVFSVPADDDATSAAVYASERIRSERLLGDAVASVPFAPGIWWMGIGGDVLFSPGGIAPLAFISFDLGYRFHRHWSFSGFASVQPYSRTLRADGLETKQRLDQFGVALAYHPLVRRHVDLALGARAAASRLGVNGQRSEAAPDTDPRRDAVWTAFVAGRVTLRVAATKRLWFRLQGDVGAFVPRAEISAQSSTFGSLGEFAAQVGLGMEVHFR